VEQDLAALAGRLSLRSAIEVVPNDSLLTRGSFEVPQPAPPAPLTGTTP